MYLANNWTNNHNKNNILVIYFFCWNEYYSSNSFDNKIKNEGKKNIEFIGNNNIFSDNSTSNNYTFAF